MDELTKEEKAIWNKAIESFYIEAIHAYYDDSLDECELNNIERKLKK